MEGKGKMKEWMKCYLDGKEMRAVIRDKQSRSVTSCA